MDGSLAVRLSVDPRIPPRCLGSSKEPFLGIEGRIAPLMRIEKESAIRGFAVVFGFLASVAWGDEPLGFNRDIRPILSDKCFQCHGPDSVTRQANLRLDEQSGLNSVIKAGDPTESRLIGRITHGDSDLRMPPVDSGRQLDAEEVELLTEWIAQGAAWQNHWSFIPPERPHLPTVTNRRWVKHPIDNFILSRLESSGLHPAPEASKTTFLRRVTFDLIGLPPTISEIDRFLADDSPNAYERVVDRLLDSPHYGERMAAQWLDASRYADSHGYSLDRRRVMWPWRDWVIQAFQTNMPYDQFVVEQIAGDLLPDATLDQRLATGFNRNHPIQSEGGVINEEYRVETVVDRVETTSAVFLGLTMGCARCHDHKYEPISQKEFFEFYAFFNNLPETAHVGNRDNDVDAPVLQTPTALQASRMERLASEIRLARTLAERSRIEQPPMPVDTIWFDDDLPVGAKPFGNGNGPKNFMWVDGPDDPILSGKRSSKRTCRELGQHGFEGAQPLKIKEDTELFISVFVDPDDPPREIMLQWKAAGSWEHRVYWGENLIQWGQDQSTSRRSMGPLPQAGQWVRLQVKAADVGLVDGTTIDGWALTQHGGTLFWDLAGINGTGSTSEEDRLGELERELNQLIGDQPRVMVMAEMAAPRKTVILNRGQYDRPSDIAVQSNIPAVLGVLDTTLDDQKPADRLDLARWLVSADNPLTARVAVNRFWQMYFGSGLVATPEDFGSQGALPSHPELLDWLASEFVRSGWDVKALQKQIVMSGTYRQSSHLSPELLEKDPDNRLLARGPRFRLPAEMIRDQALAISGLLVDRIGGPSVLPYQPPGLWDEVVYGNVPRFRQDHGDKLYRRSLYTYWKRSVPPPNLQVFDAPSREACVLKRSRTNTPLAALVLMNDPTFVEASRKLAERTLNTVAGDETKRLQWMFRSAISRSPSPHELSLLQSTLNKAKSRYAERPESARQLLMVGESDYDAGLSVIELAAFSIVANAVLNTDEVITKN